MTPSLMQMNAVGTAARAAAQSPTLISSRRKRATHGEICAHHNKTTSVLTATTLKYTIEAGITAGAGTRLILQLLLLQYFIL